MPLPELLRTSALRLALWQALLFVLTAALLAGIVAWQVHAYARGELRAAVHADVQRLLDELDEPGAEPASAQVAQQLAARRDSHDVLALLDRDGRMLVGNLPARVNLRGAAPGWHSVTMPHAYDPGDGDDASAELWLQPLHDGRMLVVGRDRSSLIQLDETLSGAFAAAFGFALALALAGGLLLGRSYLRRVRTVGERAERIMAGDLTARVPARAQGGDEFDLLGRQLNAMLTRIQSLMEDMRQVSNDIAHDLRTPLTHLRQRLERAAEDNPATLRATLQQAQRDVDQVLATFAAMLAIARVEARERRAGFAPVDLGALLETLADDYAPVADERGQRLLAQITSGLQVQGDRHLLTQLFANLIENAMTHCPAHTRITLTLRRTDAHSFEAGVADDGPGIPAAERERVLKRFYRLDRSRGTPGSGLGLALVQAIAALHGCTLEIADNAPGTRVILRGACAAEAHA